MRTRARAQARKSNRREIYPAHPIRIRLSREKLFQVTGSKYFKE